MLHALKEYAVREKLTAELGLKPQQVRWLLIFSPHGQFIGVQNLAGDDRKSKGREFPSCPMFEQPEMVAIGNGCRHFLVDNLGVICLFIQDNQNDEKLLANHDFFVGLLDEASDVVPDLAPIAKALRNDTTLEAIRTKLTEKKAKSVDWATLVVESESGPRIFIEHNDWHAWWHAFRAHLADRRKTKKAPKKRDKKGECGNIQPTFMRCFLSGDMVEPMSTHNTIEGLFDVDGRAKCMLVSFDKDAFCSYGLEQGANAAMSETMVKTYVTALNDLISRHSYRMAGTKIVCWYSGNIDPEDDPLPQLFGDRDASDDDENEEEEPLDAKQQERLRKAERIRAESTAARLLNAIRSGERAELGNCRYYAATLSANGPRVVVRNWMEGQFESLVTRLDVWSRALELQNITGLGLVKQPGLGRLVTCLLPDLKPDQDKKKWLRVGNTWCPVLWTCALRGASVALLEAVAHRALLQIRGAMLCGEISEAIDPQSAKRSLRLSSWYARLALIKMYCIAKGDNEMIAYLNENHPNPAYHCGRFLAVCQHIQSTAIGEPNAGFLDRFYASASSSPGLVIPRIWRTALHHLKTVRSKNTALGDDLWTLLRTIHAGVQDEIPTTLSLYEQGLFQLGFFHQQAFLPTERTTRQNRYSTKTRVSVRSKSEVIIANTLTDMGINYSYEREIAMPDIPGSTLWPDFTIDRDGDRPPIIIEHLGMLDRPAYHARWEQKLVSYRQLDIELAENNGGQNGVLVTTTEADVEDTAAFAEKIKHLLDIDK